MIPNLRYAVLFLFIFLFQSPLFAGTNPFLATASETVSCPSDGSQLSKFTLCGFGDIRSFQLTDNDILTIEWQQLMAGSCGSVDDDCPNTNLSCGWNTLATGTSFTLDSEGEFRVIVAYTDNTSESFYAKSTLNTYSDAITVTKNISINGLADGEITIYPNGNAPFQHAISSDGGFTYGPFQSSSVFTNLGPGDYLIKTIDNSGVCEYVSSVVVLTEPAPLVADLVITKLPTCVDFGEIMVNTTGGTLPYEYSIDGVNFVSESIFSNLSPANYSITVRDASNAIVITNVALFPDANDSIDISVSIQSIGCYGENQNSVFVQGHGGTGNYEYQLANDYDNIIVPFQTNPYFNDLIPGNYIVYVRDSSGCLIAWELVINEPLPLIIDVTVNEPSSQNTDGTITVNALGGSGGYQFAISPNLNQLQSNNVFTNLGVGTYTILIQDRNGCTETIDVTLTAADSLQLNVSKTDVSCNANGTIEAEVSGGVPPYIYELDGVLYGNTNNFNGLTAGVYNVSVKDANNTFVAKAIEISTEPPIVLTINNQSISCFGAQDGQIEFGATGGSGIYQFSLIDASSGVLLTTTSFIAENYTFENLAAGLYQVTVVDSSGCTLEGVTVILEPEPLVLESFKTNPSSDSANDGSIALNALGGAGNYEYSIDSGVTFMATGFFENLAKGFYEVAVRDSNGCKQIDVVQLGSSELTLTATVQNHITCGAQAKVLLTPSGGVPPYEYSSNGSSYTTTNPFITGSSGLTTFTVRDANGTTATSNAVTINADDETIRFNAGAALDCDGINLPVVTINITRGSGTLQYSIYDGIWQDSPTFLDVPDGNYVVKAKNESCEFALPLTVENVEPVKVRVLEQNEGKVTFQILSGEGPFNYRVNSYSSPRIEIGNNTTFEIDNLSPGPYWIVVDAANCSDHVTFDVEGFIPELKIETQINNVSCFGDQNGSISVVGVGGLGEYNYGLVDGDNNIIYNVRPEIKHFDGLAPGTYKALVRDTRQGLLVRSELITITEPEQLVAWVEATHGSQLSTNTGIADLNIEGGSQPYEYRLDASMTFVSVENLTITDLAAGDHIVTFQDANGCQMDVIFTIETLPEIDATVNVEYTGCEENEILVNASGGSGTYMYAINSVDINEAQSSNKFLNIPSGSYSVTIFDANGSISNVSFDIEEFITMDVNTDITYNDDESSANVSLDVTGGSAPYSYSIDGDVFQETATFIDLTKKSYTFHVKDSLGCIEERIVELVYPEDSISGKDDNIVVYQNSGRTEVFDVLWEASEASQTILVIYNTKGTTVYTSEYEEGMAQTQINVGNLSRGIYFIYIKNDEFEEVKKVLIQ